MKRQKRLPYSQDRCILRGYLSLPTSALAHQQKSFSILQIISRSFLKEAFMKKGLKITPQKTVQRKIESYGKR